jgi:hypothetical protein
MNRSGFATGSCQVAVDRKSPLLAAFQKKIMVRPKLFLIGSAIAMAACSQVPASTSHSTVTNAGSFELKQMAPAAASPFFVKPASHPASPQVAPTPAPPRQPSTVPPTQQQPPTGDRCSTGTGLPHKPQPECIPA